MRYLVIDTETTGLNVQDDVVLELAVVAAEYPTEQPIESFPKYVAQIAYPRVTGDPYALAANSRVLGMIARGQAKSPGTVWRAFRTFLHDHAGSPKLPSVLPKDGVLVAGKNVWKTDLPMIIRSVNAELPGASAAAWFDYRALDPAQLYFDPRSDRRAPNLAECCRRAGFPPDRFKFHDAYEDCLAVIACLHHAWDKGAKPCPPPAA